MPLTRINKSDWSSENRINIMHRPDLYDTIRNNLHCPLIGVISDSGFGKTALIQGFMAYEGKNVLWCTFTDNEPIETLLDEIMGQLGSDDSIEAVVFDNCGIVSNESLFTTALPEIIAAASGANVFILGTTLPPLHFAVMRAKDQYFEFTHENLALNHSEIEAYFNDYLGLALRPHEIDIIYDKTQGWFISLQLINAYLRKNRMANLDELDLNFLADITDINDYFSYNLFENQTSEMQQFLLQTSPMTELEVDVINELLNIDNADEFIAELNDHHGFVQTSPNRHRALHPLLRQFLYGRYMGYASAKCVATHNRLIEIYEKKRNYITAFSHAVAGNNYPAAIRLMAKISDRYNPIQLLNIIDGHLEDISPALLFSNTSMFLTRCLPDGLLSELVQPLTEAINHEFDSLKLANLQHRLGIIYFHIGNIQMSKSFLEKSLTNSETLHNTEVMAFNYQLLADCHLILGDTTQALRCARNALYLAEQNNLMMLQIHTLEVFSRIQLALNHVDQAEDYITQALDLIPSDAYEVFFIYAAHSMVDIATGNYEAAIAHATKATQIVADSITGYDIGYTNYILALALISNGDVDKAKEHLNIAINHSTHSGYHRIEILTAALEIETDDSVRTTLTEEINKLITANNCKDFIKTPLVSDAPIVPPMPIKPQYIVINTFDSFSVSHNSIPITIKRSASLRMLQLFIVNRGRYITKEYIIDNLFPDSSASAGANNFNVALSVLRKSMDSAAGLSASGDSCIIRQRDKYKLNPEFVTIDAEDFEEKYRKLKKEDCQDVQLWLELSGLFSGTFMAEYPYEQFLMSERERLTSYHKDVRLIIARIFSSAGDVIKALTYYNQAFELDMYDEDAYYEAIEFLLDNKMPGKAQIVADKMKLHIEEELGVECSSHIASLFEYYNKHN